MWRDRHIFRRRAKYKSENIETQNNKHQSVFDVDDTCNTKRCSHCEKVRIENNIK